MCVLGKSNSVHMKLQKGVAKKAYNLFPDYYFFALICILFHKVNWKLKNKHKNWLPYHENVKK